LPSSLIPSDRNIPYLFNFSYVVFINYQSPVQKKSLLLKKKAWTMNPKLTLLLLFLSGLLTLPVKAQENLIRKDSIKLPSRESHVSTTDSAVTSGVSVTIPTIHPVLGKGGLQYNRFSDFSIAPYLTPRTQRSNIQFHGTGSDDINSKSRTAVATYTPAPRISLYSAATLGLVETPFFGKANYYILNGGVNYLLSSNLNAGISGMYNSNFNLIPFWSLSADLQYMAGRNLMLESSLSYMQTANNPFNLDQSAVQIDLHGRYRLTDDWFLNAYGGFPVSQKSNLPSRNLMPMMDNTHYGGTVEYWFQPTMGAEAGLIWVRDIFSGKMRPQPKLELKFRPGK
jgi:hypothetical protein